MAEVRLPPPAAAAAPWALAALSVTRSSTVAVVAACVFLRYLAVVVAHRTPVRSDALRAYLGSFAALAGCCLAAVSSRTPALFAIAALAGTAGGFFAAATAEAHREPRGWNLPPALLTSFWRATGAAVGVLTAVFTPAVILVVALAAASLSLAARPVARHPIRQRAVSPLSSVTHALVNASPVVALHVTDDPLLAGLSLVMLQVGSALALIVVAHRGHSAHVIGSKPYLTGVTHHLASLCALVVAAGYASFSTSSTAACTLLVSLVLGSAGELAKHAHITAPEHAHGVPASVVVQSGLLLAGPVGYLAATPAGVPALAAVAATLTLVLQLPRSSHRLRR